MRERANGDARAIGSELELEWRASRMLALTTAWAINDSKFTSGELDGKRTPQVPRVGGSVGVRANAGAFTGALNVRVIGAQFDDDINTFHLAQGIARRRRAPAGACPAASSSSARSRTRSTRKSTPAGRRSAPSAPRAWRAPASPCDSDRLIRSLFDDPAQLATAAAEDAAARIRTAIEQRGRARIIAATGASQIQFLDRLVREPGIDWTKVEMFHLDEYIGLPIDHPASFRKYLLERLIEPAGITHYHLLDGERDAATVCREVGRVLRRAPIDVAFAGIGENGHLAFNDPPADFDTEDPYLVVRLDDALPGAAGGGRLVRAAGGRPGDRDLDVGPPDSQGPRDRLRRARSAQGRGGTRGRSREPIDPMVPASILRRHPDVTIYLDRDSASLLKS